MKVTEAIKEAERLARLTGENYLVFKNLSGYEVISDSFAHTAMGNFVHETHLPENKLNPNLQAFIETL